METLLGFMLHTDSGARCPCSGGQVKDPAKELLTLCLAPFGLDMLSKWSGRLIMSSLGDQPNSLSPKKLTGNVPAFLRAMNLLLTLSSAITCRASKAFDEDLGDLP